MNQLPTSDEYVTLYTDGSVIFSELGIDKYRAIFARAGYDINKVRDMPTYHQAMSAIVSIEHEDLLNAQTGNGKWYKAESTLLQAIIEQDESAVAFLSDQIQRRKKAGFKLVKGRKKSD